MKHHPVLAFYILAFVISWMGMIPQALYAQGLFPFEHPLFSFLGGGGPTIAAVIVTSVVYGRDKNKELFKPLLKWRTEVVWYLVAFLGWFVIAGLALGVGALLGQPFPALGQFAWSSIILIFAMMLLSNVWEEVGWRGFALPRLQQKYSDLAIALGMGLIWSLWHLPLMLNPDNLMASLSWYGEIVFSLTLSVIYIWLYNHTKRSLLFVTVFHAMSNTMAYALLGMGVFISSYLTVVGVTFVLALVIILVYGPKRFGKQAKLAINTET